MNLYEELEVTGITMDKDQMDIMVYDYLADHPEYEDSEDGPLQLDGEPYLDADTGLWMQDAHDNKCAYSLVAEIDGNIYIHYQGTM